MAKLMLLPGTGDIYVDNINNPEIEIHVAEISTPHKGKQFIIKQMFGTTEGYVGNFNSPEEAIKATGNEIIVITENFTEDVNYQTHYACNLIRLSWFVYALGMVKRSEKDGMSELGKVGKGSVINSLISRNDWKNLFKNNEWLEILSAVQNINSLVEPKKERDLIYKQLNYLIGVFPKETAGFICTFSLK